MNEPITIIVGRAIPLRRADVDTDQIIPARHLRRLERDGFGRFAFAGWRADPTFVLNDPGYAGAPIMITGSNFGCGSSREHAAWALHDLGLRALIAPSFADIFAHNAANVGLLTIELGPEAHGRLLALAAAAPAAPWTVDLERQLIAAPGADGPLRFDVDPSVKRRLTSGRDPIDATLERVAEIAAHERRRPTYLPRTRPPEGGPR